MIVCLTSPPMINHVERGSQLHLTLWSGCGNEGIRKGRLPHLFFSGSFELGNLLPFVRLQARPLVRHPQLSAWMKSWKVTLLPVTRPNKVTKTMPEIFKPDNRIVDFCGILLFSGALKSSLARPAFQNPFVSHPSPVYFFRIWLICGACSQLLARSLAFKRHLVLEK